MAFTNPFFPSLHPLCIEARNELMALVAKHPEWHADLNAGKMLGVLAYDGGYLAAFSGTLCGKSVVEPFVPPVYDLHDPNGHFRQEEQRISAINSRIASLEEQGKPADELRADRTERSRRLQAWLFGQYRFLNAKGQEASLLSIFSPKTPPAGAGECCAPKLLHHAYRLGLKPLAMAEFWVGRSPKDELRTEGNFYAACQHKCKPILTHMLQGLDVEPSPAALRAHTLIGQIRILRIDRHLMVIDKPGGLLSVPGKDGLPNVQEWARRLFPQATGPMIVHRLDQDTRGLMVLALTAEAYHHLQEQFLRREVRKLYRATLERPIEGHGVIDLPICANPYDRPRQTVSEQYGKRSITHWQATGGQEVLFTPHTGRTHQLRLHAAHPLGLGNPILGDPLYGTPHPDGLHLAAISLEFRHPNTGATMSIMLEGSRAYSSRHHEHIAQGTTSI